MGVALGGLIADAMGLGKTLTTLVSILRSTDKAVEFGHFNHQMKSVGIDTVPTKATLVVVPSARKSPRSRSTRAKGGNPISRLICVVDLSYRNLGKLGG